MLLNNKKAVIFDLDGTLIDSMGVWALIDIEYLGSRQIALPENLSKEIEGMQFRETAEYFKKRFKLEDDIETIIKTWNDMAYKKYCSEVELKKGAKKYLEYLKSNNIKIGIATSNSKMLTRTVLESKGVYDLFDTISTADEGLKGKPAPDIYLKTCSDLRIKPEECLVFEDVPMGMLAGKNANMTVCAVYDEHSKLTMEQRRQYADFYINNYDELMMGIYEVCND